MVLENGCYFFTKRTKLRKLCIKKNKILVFNDCENGLDDEFGQTKSAPNL